MFGVSFLEIAVVGLVALIIVGPQKLPAMMRTAGEWIGKLRRMTSDVRAQTGIDDILREEGIDGVHELRSLLRGQYNLRNIGNNRSSSSSYSQPTPQPPDLSAEFPTEGADCASALPDDLLDDEGPEPTDADAPAPEAATAQAHAPAAEGTVDAASEDTVDAAKPASEETAEAPKPTSAAPKVTP